MNKRQLKAKFKKVKFHNSRNKFYKQLVKFHKIGSKFVLNNEHDFSMPNGYTKGSEFTLVAVQNPLRDDPNQQVVVGHKDWDGHGAPSYCGNKSDLEKFPYLLHNRCLWYVTATKIKAV